MTPTRRDAHRRRRQEGVALVMALVLVVALLATLAALVPLAASERMLARASREAAECRYAAAAAVAYAAAELQVRAGWDSALDGSAPAAFADASRVIRLTASRPVDLTALAAAFGAVEPGAWGPDAPRWQLFAWGAARALAPGVLQASTYVAVWVADDERDGDGNPFRDSNARLRLRGEALGPGGGRQAVIATLQREAPAPAALRVLDWRIP